MTFQEIRIIPTGPCITNQLRDVNTMMASVHTSHGIMLQDFPFPADQEVEGDKRNDFNFKIINFPNMCSNIPASPYLYTFSLDENP
jgi:hypothetical protein